MRLTLVGARMQVRPVDGDAEEFKVTVPLNALTEEMVIVEVTADPASVATIVGLAVIEKSGTLMLYVTVAV